MTPTALSLLMPADLTLIAIALQDYSTRPWRKQADADRAARLEALIIDAREELAAVTFDFTDNK